MDRVLSYCAIVCGNVAAALPSARIWLTTGGSGDILMTGIPRTPDREQR